MSGFKLLAIRPLEGCDEKFLKNLKEGVVYKFYQDYKFYIDHDKKEELTLSNYDLFKSKPIAQVVPNFNYSNEIDLYSNADSDLKINISAIVGENGSGKSTLLELLYATVYLIAEKNEMLTDDSLKHYENELSNVEQELKKNKKSTEAEWYKNTLDSINENLKNNTTPKEKVDSIQSLLNSNILKPENYERNKQELKRIVDNYKEAYDKIKLEIIFSESEDIYSIRTNSIVEYSEEPMLEKLYSKNLKKNSELAQEELLKCFCYSIVINYSIYGLNSKIIGDWINPLFHKNDGYQTPIVLNPMRTNGRFDINKEEIFAKARFTSNLLIKTETNKHRKVTDNQVAKYILFTLNRNKIRLRFERNRMGLIDHNWSNQIAHIIQQEIYTTFGVDNKVLSKNSIPAQHYVENYIINKIEKIIWVYPEYKKKFTTNLAGFRDHIFDTILEDKIKDLATELFMDNSHITFKLKQAINYLKYPLLFNQKEIKNEKIHYNKKSITVNQWDENNTKILVSIEQLSDIVEYNRSQEDKLVKQYNQDNIGSHKELELSYINMLPPSVFDIDILLTTDIPNEYSSFSQLSSGEQQRVHSLQTILYHINNVNSVFNQSRQQDGTKRREYSSINIILDEIELYFHPEYQRCFISDLREGLNSLKLGKDIKSVNILLATHSPFILSDIPSANILRLKTGMPQFNPEQTFGANIHQLLHNDFFLENGFIGEFAKTKINEVVDFLRNISWKFKQEQILKRISNENNERTKEDLIIQLEIISLEQNRIKNINRSLTIDKCKEIINLIGEPILSQSLNSLYSEVKDIKF